MYHEQAEGLIPEFTFVSINGMEMRHPFDVYVRLWEAVSPSKEVLDRPKSLAKLQLYFSESPLKKTDHEDKNRRNNRRAVILLVDEIDYLVTEKQTILYNLFDWPLAGYENKSDAQLIVIGISNTLNLPERLHPRLVSRIGKQRCIYQSYTWSESLTIIEGKLGRSVSSGEVSIIIFTLATLYF
jgi:Cdc6-related protein, AAA superfamily ATPase